MTFDTKRLGPLSLILVLGLAVASPARAKEEGADTDTRSSAEKAADEARAAEPADGSGKNAEGAQSGRQKTAKTAGKGSSESTAGKFLLAALGSWGSSAPTRGGLGLRADLELSPDLYVGFLGQYFFGNSQETAGLGDRITQKHNLIVAEPEVAYDVAVATDFSMRPYLGVGIGIPMSERCSSGECNADTSLAVALNPGLTGLYHLAPLVLGVDFRYLIVIAEANTSAMVASAVVGLSF